MRFWLVLIAALILIAACGRGSGLPTEGPEAPVPSPAVEQTPTPEPAAPTAVPTPSSTPTSTATLTGARTLFLGEFHLPAAKAFGQSGFHEVLRENRALPVDMGETMGSRLVLRLRDAGRPTVDCFAEHPLSGCATVDWSDAESRPNVPRGGVFENSVTLELASGARTFFLSESGGLNDAPDRFDPG